ncbi:Uncharacterised protein [Mycobacteroides abscessus subsp. abscessus]|uniref:hypothetical protein n=1 Tax=Mycobacteroides abscessus TaxID=36809 RepID=UPI000925B105|nr:hypothetical protein [Mycobacteroides abscessus]SIK10925.1 Uncharacterised protein [Mycobacteroides abscessus subsp. abscessus]
MSLDAVNEVMVMDEDDQGKVDLDGGAHELDALLMDRFGIDRTSFVTALKSLPAVRPWAAALSPEEARLLDDADFHEDPASYIAAATEVAGHLGVLKISAFSAGAVASGLRISASRVRQKRLARELWAIADGASWVFPVPQFVTDERGSGQPVRVIRGLGEVFKALPEDLHPVAVDGFLRTPQPELYLDRALAPVDWLRGGGAVDKAVAAARNIDWTSR